MCLRRFLVSAALILAAHVHAQEIAAASSARLLRVADKAWAGSSINVVANIRSSLFTEGSVQYAAFYDADGFLVLGKRVLGSDHWETRRTAHQGNVADAHNSISIAVDGAGYLHVSWDHHNNPLNYARSVAPGSLELGPKSAMTGERENRVTYPQFFRLPNGDLLALYRDGASGNGSLVLNRYATAEGKWSTVQANLIDGEGKRSPYWSMVVDGRGTLHLAWTWRESPDVSSNHDLAYARSADGGRTWTKTDGTALPLPLTAGNCEYAAHIPEKSNLMNPPSLAADGQGRPWLADYWSPAPGEAPRFHLVRHDGKEWQTIAGPAAATPFTLAGTATKRPPFSRTVVLTEGNNNEPLVHLVYRDDARGSRVIAATYNIHSGAWTDTELTSASVGAWEPSHDPVAWQRFAQLQVLVQNVQQPDGNDHASAAAPTPLYSLVLSPKQFRTQQLIETPAEPIAAAELEKPFNADSIRSLAQRAADWQWANFPPTSRERHPRGWVIAPFYLGVLALDRISPDHHNRDTMLKQAETLGWQPHDKLYHADDHCVIQAYLELYHDLKDPRMIAASQKRFDDVLAKPTTGKFDWGTPNSQDNWSWCDALFMAPNAWVLLWKETGDRRYLDFMNRNWWLTTERLYNRDTGFYFRDESYLDLREPNGKTIHWSRGNGWVFAGLARVIDNFPKDHPDYPRYVQLFREMAVAVLKTQQPDGLWRSGVLDSNAHFATETSGSSFLTFGLAWGINRGLLDRATTEPAVRRAWNSLARCVTPEGKLEHVQPIGAAPQSFDPHNTEAFAVGAFLLTASEVYRLAPIR